MTTHGRPSDWRGRASRGNYWIYSAGVAIVWAIVIALHAVIGGGSTLRDTFLIFGGFTLGWLSATIARYTYPPPRRWKEYYQPSRR